MIFKVSATNKITQKVTNEVLVEYSSKQECLSNINNISSSWGDSELFDLSIEDLQQEIVNQQSLSYIKSTDWYVIRFMDNGTEVPEEIKNLRQEARERIVR